MLSPLFSTVRLAAGKSGLSNNVLYIGFLDWEDSEQIPQYFNAGEIVITTLLKAKDDRQKAENYLKALSRFRECVVIYGIEDFRALGLRLGYILDVVFGQVTGVFKCHDVE